MRETRTVIGAVVIDPKLLTAAEQTEGQITRLKLVRRQMYGRGKIGLLQARLISAE